MTPIFAPFPMNRPRRMRAHPWIREMVSEHRITPGDLIWPLFVRGGEGVREPVASMPGVERLSVDQA